MGIASIPKRITKAFESSIKRFPLTAIVSLALTITLISIIEGKREPSLLTQRLAMIFALSIPITLSAKLAWERKKKTICYYTIWHLLF